MVILTDAIGHTQPAILDNNHVLISIPVLYVQALATDVSGNPQEQAIAKTARLDARDMMSAQPAKPIRPTTAIGTKMAFAQVQFMNAGNSLILQLVLQILVANLITELAIQKCVQIS